jgi:hypothetical protein
VHTEKNTLQMKIEFPADLAPSIAKEFKNDQICSANSYFFVVFGEENSPQNYIKFAAKCEKLRSSPAEFALHAGEGRARVEVRSLMTAHSTSPSNYLQKSTSRCCQ